MSGELFAICLVFIFLQFGCLTEIYSIDQTESKRKDTKYIDFRRDQLYVLNSTKNKKHIVKKTFVLNLLNYGVIFLMMCCLAILLFVNAPVGRNISWLALCIAVSFYLFLAAKDSRMARINRQMDVSGKLNIRLKKTARLKKRRKKAYNKSKCLKRFVADFIKNYLPDVKNKTLKKCHILPPNGYLWMACEHGFVKSYCGEEAMKKYDMENKEEAISVSFDALFESDRLVNLTEDIDTAEKVKASGLTELYIVGKNFSWCYIVTHEPNGRGPYFIIRDETDL